MSIELRNGKYRANASWKGKKAKGPLRATRDQAQMDEARLLLELGADKPEDLHAWTVYLLCREQITHGNYSPSSVGPMEHALRAMPQELRQMQAGKLTTPALFRYLEQMPNLEYRRKARNLLGAAYKRGVLRGIVSTNPTIGVPSGQSKAKEVVPPTVEQLQSLLEAAQKVNPPFAVFLMLGAHIGCRRGELVAFKWSDLDKDDKGQDQILICRSLAESKGKITVRATKTGERTHRKVALSPEVRALLDSLPRYDGCPWLFTHDGKEPWRPTYVSAVMGKLSDDFTLHSLRHHAATQMFANNFSVVDVAHRLGDSPTTVLKVYSHHVKSRDRAIADSLPCLIGPVAQLAERSAYTA